MVMLKQASPKARIRRFGGDWTAIKLDLFATYLESFTSALRNKPSVERAFCKTYIDAFSSTGYRATLLRSGAEIPALFPDLAAPAPQMFLNGTARLALQTEPRFDRYHFLERDTAHGARLRALKEEIPGVATRVRITRGDANDELRHLADQDWSLQRAVLFLDPCGMEVQWATLEAIARTKAIDLALMIPLGLGVDRLLGRSGSLPADWRARLDELLGAPTWCDELQRATSAVLPGAETEQAVRAVHEILGQQLSHRLQSVFAAVARESAVLRSSDGTPLYLMCFAAGNDKTAPITLRAAHHFLKDLR